jgi:hypothetical protein
VRGELQERIARALAAWYSSDDDDRHWERYTGAAGIALVALGLDDLDAAVERATVALLRMEGAAEDEIEESWLIAWRDHSRAALEAALTPPETVAKKERDAS